ncbi:MAG TPA: OsmC family protein [Saprospiraceae bacterium]|nr:OsmC family protein [Saprospiraceae bacterium]HNM24053.1 OsmC family protein [Saprospiraceae bacterium]
MSQHHVTTRWAGKMAFDSTIGHHVVRIDTKPDAGDDTGPGPKSLLLVALTGCTGIDMAALLPKMRVVFDTLEIEATAPLTEEHPKVYTEINLVYRISGKNISEEKVRRAIELSQDKYCGVTAMLKAHCPIHWSLEVLQSEEG